MDTADLRAWRARRRWTQEQAASALGYTRRGYQEVEGREGDLPSRLHKALAELLAERSE